MKLISKIGWGSAVALPLAFLIIFFMWPVGAMLLRGLFGVDAAEASFLGGMVDLLREERTWQIIWQTLWMAVAGAFFSILCGVPAAYLLYLHDFPGRQLLRGLLTIPFVLPTVVVGIAFRSLLGGPLAFLNMANTPWAVVLAMVFFNCGLITRMVGNMWASLDPCTEQAARTLGASPYRAFFSITLPQLAPAIAAAGGLAFLYCSTAYGVVTTLGNPGYGTIETEIYIQTVTFFDLDKAAMLSVLQFIIVLLALIVGTRLTARTETALQVRPRSRRSLRQAPLLPKIITILAVFLVLFPIVSLILNSFRYQGHWTLDNYRLLSTTGFGFSGGTSVLEAIDHSVRIAFDSMIFALLVSVPLALVLSRRVQGKWLQAQRFLDGVTLLPLGVSAVTVGFGFLITFAGTDIANSGLIVPLAQSVVALPLVIRSLVPLLRAIDPRMREAASVLGATPAQVLRTIDMPFLLRGIGLAAGFAFAVSLGEFGATSFLADPAYLTLPVVIVKLLSRAGQNNYGMALAGAVLLAVVTAFVIISAEFIGSRNRDEQRIGQI